MKKGNIMIVGLIFMAIGIVVILFIAAIFMSHVNTILYDVKVQMYAINKAAILAVNKNATSVDAFSYHVASYRTYFENALRENFRLNQELENKNQLIQKIKIREYRIIPKGNKDTFTGAKTENQVIHTVIEAKIKPIILPQVFEKIFTFEIHEDVNLNRYTVNGKML